MKHFNGFQSNICAVCVARNSHCERVNDNIFLFNSVFFCFGNNFFCNGNSALCRFGNSALVNRNGDQNSAVFFDKRKNSFHALRLAADRVNQSLAVVDSHCSFHGFGVNRVNLKRQVNNALNGAYHALHHLRLVDFGQTDIDIKHRNALDILADRFAENVADISASQRFLEAFFACRIDSLADDNGVFADFNGVGV